MATTQRPNNSVICPSAAVDRVVWLRGKRMDRAAYLSCFTGTPNSVGASRIRMKILVGASPL